MLAGYKNQQRLVRVCRKWKYLIGCELDHIYALWTDDRSWCAREKNRFQSTTAESRIHLLLPDNPKSPWKYHCPAVREVTFDGQFRSELGDDLRQDGLTDIWLRRFPNYQRLNIVNIQLRIPIDDKIKDMVTWFDPTTPVWLTIHNSFIVAFPRAVECSFLGFPELKDVYYKILQCYKRCPFVQFVTGDGLVAALNASLDSALNSAEETEWVAKHASSLDAKLVERIFGSLLSYEKRTPNSGHSTMRCCRRWNRLLHSSAVLHAVIVQLPWPDTPAVSAVLIAAAPHVANMVVTARETWSLSEWQQKVDTHWSGLQVLDVLAYDLPPSQHFQRRVVVSRVTHPVWLFMTCSWNKDFAIKELRDVTLQADEVLAILDAGDLLRKYPLLGSSQLSSDVTVHLPGSHVLQRPFISADSDDEDDDAIPSFGRLGFLTRLIKTYIAPLTQQERQSMLQRLLMCDEMKVRKIMGALVVRFQPDFLSTADQAQSLATFPFDLCSPLVGPLLACFDATDCDDLPDGYMWLFNRLLFESASDYSR